MRAPESLLKGCGKGASPAPVSPVGQLERWIPARQRKTKRLGSEKHFLFLSPGREERSQIFQEIEREICVCTSSII